MTAAGSPQVPHSPAHRCAGPRLPWGSAPSLSFMFSQHQASHPPEVGFFPQGGFPGGLEGPEENEEPLQSPLSSSKAHLFHPLPWACFTPSLPGWGTHSNPPPDSWSVLGGGSSPGLVPSALGVGPWPDLVTLPLLRQTSRSSARGRPSTTWSCTSWPSTASSSRASRPRPLSPSLPAPTPAQDSCEGTAPRASGSPACVCRSLDGVSGPPTPRVHHFPARHRFGAPPALLNFQRH